jgi:hypothetical protein
LAVGEQAAAAARRVRAMTVVHPPLPILNVIGCVIAHVREDDALSDALNEYAARNPTSENVAIRWLRKKWGFEVTLKFGNDALEHMQEG